MVIQVDLRHKFTIIILAIFLLSLTLIYAWKTAHPNTTINLTEHNDQGLNLNIFSEDKLKELLAKAGVKIPWASTLSVRRNLSGTKLLVDDDRLFGSTCWVVTLSDNIEIINLDKPARIGYIDDENNFIAWTDDYKKGFNFAGGVTLPLSMASRIGFDLSSTYLFVTESGITKIVSASNPLCTLAEAKMSASHIYLCDDTLYLFGYPDDGHFLGNPVAYQTFRIRDEKIFDSCDTEIIDRPRYFCSLHVVDMDTSSGKVLLRTHYDPPATFLSSWYIYDLRNKNMKQISRIGKGKQYGFFLSKDIFVPRRN